MSAPLDGRPAPAGRLLDAEVGRLARRLAGPRRLRRDMVAEVRDGLLDAAAAHEDAGAEPAVAERRALAEFGDLDAVARELQAELGVRVARRAALVLGLAFLPVVLAWDLVWRLTPQAGPPPADGVAQAYAAFDMLQIAAGIAGALLAVALQRPRVRSVTRRAAGLLGVATPVVVAGFYGSMLVYGDGGHAPALATPVIALLILASGAVMVGSLATGVRSLRLELPVRG